jgi:Ca-activated chloride channel family protein
MLTVKLRYKDPDGITSRRIEVPLTDRGAGFDQGSGSLRFAAAVATFGMILRGSPHVGPTTLADAARIARDAIGADRLGYRAEFVGLIDRAAAVVKTGHE